MKISRKFKNLIQETQIYLSQPAFTYLKLTVETIFKVNNKDIRMTP